MCFLWCLCLCVLPVSVEVCACLCVCVLGSSMGQGCLDGDGADVEGSPEVWGVRNAAVREEA